MWKPQRLLLGALVVSVCLFHPLEAASASEGAETPATFRGYPLLSEADFLKAMGSRALPVSEGVYDVVLASHETVRFAFGEKGRDFDRDLLQRHLEFLEASLLDPSPLLPARKRQVEALREIVEGFDSWSSRASTGWVTCNNISYDYSLDGGFTINPVIEYAWGSSQIGLQLDFGPFPESYPSHAAGVLIFTKTSATPCSLETDYDLVDDGTHDYAQAWTLSTCTNCLGWRVLSYVDTECSGTYRSITRTGGAPVCS